MADTPMIADQFKGLPMGDLIGGPLMAACNAQVQLAQATANFIQTVGFLPQADGATTPQQIRQVAFQFNRPAGDTPGADGTIPTETVSLNVPLLAVVKIPALSITNVDITFNMEVKNSTSDSSSSSKEAKGSVDASVGWGPFSAKISISGSVSSSSKSERSSDSSAKYNVSVKAQDTGMPEGLARVLDIMNQAIAPSKISANSNSNAGANGNAGGNGG